MSLIDADALVAEASRRNQLASSRLLDRLATLAGFDPSGLEDEPDLAAVLELFCDELEDPTNGTVWSISPGSRVERLAAMLGSGGTAAVEAARDTVHGLDSPLQRMLDAFIRQREVPLEERSEDELIESLTVLQWVREAVRLAGLAHGEVATGPDRAEIEARLDLLAVTRPVRKLADAGCFGRDDELKRLREYAASAPGPLDEEPALVVYGIGGVGKSTLIARFVMDLVDPPGGVERLAEPSAWAYLDMDRPALRSYRPEAILTELIRQLAVQFPEKDFLRDWRVRTMGEGPESDPRWGYMESLAEVAELMKAELTEGPFVVVLDTFEEVERAEEDLREEIYRMFHFLSLELGSLKLIVSGRAPAQDFIDPERPDRRLPVEVFRGAGALSLLGYFSKELGGGVLAPDLAGEVVAAVGGSPLALKLAARVLAAEGKGAFQGAVERAGALEAVRREFVRGFLYQRILDHIVGDDLPGAHRRGIEDPVPSDALRAVARAAIVLRRVTPRLIDDVICPALEPRPRHAAGRLFELLAREVAFARVDGAELTLRQELRGPALRALEYDDASLVRRVHERAKAFYQPPSDEPGARVELTYHRLALGEEAALEQADAKVLKGIEPAVADLPSGLADAVRSGIAEPEALDEARQLASWELKVFSEVESARRSGERDRAWKLLGERIERSPGTKLYGLESLLYEDAGDLGRAIETARKDRVAAEAAGDRVRFAAAALRAAKLLESEEPGEALMELRDASDHPFIVGDSELRLELKLNEIAARERTGKLDDERRWSLGLEARGLLRRIAPDAIEKNTALPRLLAAAFGREEPSRLRQAARVVGLGPDPSPGLAQSLAGAITQWDSDRDGALASEVGVTRFDDDPEDAWRSAFSGLEEGDGRLVEQLWQVERPPEPVREAIRALYVWWGERPRQIERPRRSRPVEWDDEESPRALEAAMADRDYATAGHLLDALVADLAKTGRRVGARTARKVLAILRKYAWFAKLELIAGTFEKHAQDDEQVLRQLAQARIELGEITAAIGGLLEFKTRLERRLEGQNLSPVKRKELEDELGETMGLLGRSYKQLYLDAKPSKAEPRSYDLARSLGYYGDAFKAGLGDYLWHGVNYVALLTHKERIAKNNSSLISKEAAKRAQEILAIIDDKERKGPLQPWDMANRIEANLAIGNLAVAVTAARIYLEKADAFAIQSTRRQLIEVWMLTEEQHPGSLILPMMNARFAERGGMSQAIELDPAKAATYEKVWSETGYKPLRWLRQAFATSKSVARIGSSRYDGGGTGFLLDGGWISGRWAGRHLLLTNAHVCSDDLVVQRQYPNAHPPEELTASFLGSGAAGVVELRLNELVWTSPPSELDATLLLLEDVPAGYGPLTRSARKPQVTLKSDARLNILGFSMGLDLRLSMLDSKMVDVGERCVRYKSSTGPASSGSPVFNQKWELVAVHRAFSAERSANEGVRIDVLIDAMKADLA